MREVDMGLIMHINGWPGCGKLTIARLLAKQLGARLVDNHALINPAECLFARNDANYWPLRKAVRALAFEYAARLAPGTPLVFTDALADIASDRAVFDDCLELASKRGAKLIAVVLECEEEENLRRLTAGGRAEQLKLTDEKVLRDLRAKYRLLRPTDVTCIDLEVSALPAGEVAAALHRHCTQALADPASLP
jgi:thymidylate kinase